MKQGLLSAARVLALGVLSLLGAGCGASTSTEAVGTGQAPTIIGFSASPSGIVPGGSALLTWAVDGATSVSITPGGGIASAGMLSVQPTATTTYTLTATNVSGSVTATVKVSVGTPLTGNILADRVLTLSGSPYIIPFDTPVVVYNATLSLEPDVEVHGPITLREGGRLLAIGSAGHPVTFSEAAVVLTVATSAVPTASVPVAQMSHCNYQGQVESVTAGNVFIDHSTLDVGSLALGQGSVTDSRLTVRGYLTARSGSAERNVFTFDSPDRNVWFRNAMGHWNRIVNNVFQSSLKNSSALLVVVTNPESVDVLKANSFLLWKSAIQVDQTSGFDQPTSPVTMDWSGNYWGTTDLATIRAMIYDASTAPWLMTTIGVVPILTSPDPLTPVP